MQSSAPGSADKGPMRQGIAKFPKAGVKVELPAKFWGFLFFLGTFHSDFRRKFDFAAKYSRDL